jgi:hypothetical protein
LSDVGCFGDKAAQEQIAKASKTKGGNTPNKPLTNSIPWAPTAQKGTYIASASTQLPTDQKADNKLKATAIAEDKEVLVDHNNQDFHC